MELSEDESEVSFQDSEGSNQPRKNNSLKTLGDEEVIFGVSPWTVKMPKEETSKFLQRVTHLHCENKRISMIADLRTVKNLTVLYLYNNKIKTIDCMSHVPHLKLLYLQHNDIEKLEGLESLAFLGRNILLILNLVFFSQRNCI